MTRTTDVVSVAEETGTGRRDEDRVAPVVVPGAVTVTTTGDVLLIGNDELRPDDGMGVAKVSVTVTTLGNTLPDGNERLLDTDTVPYPPDPVKLLTGVAMTLEPVP